MKKLSLILCMFLLCMASSFAQTGNKRIILHLSNNTTRPFYVSEIDSITFDEEQVTVNTAALQANTRNTATVTVGVGSGRSMLSVLGIYYSTDKENLAEGATMELSVPDEGDATFSITGLTKGTLYHVLAYGKTESDSLVLASDTLHFTTFSDFPTPTAVDMGVSVKWASFNVGAETANGLGNYIAWGSTSGDLPESIDIETPDASSGIAGSENDIATVKWGKGWQMPTQEQWKELYNNCDKSFGNNQGVKGWTFTSKITGNSIFLPATGYYSTYDKKYIYQDNVSGTFYWTSGQYSSSNAAVANILFVGCEIQEAEKYKGFAVRAVYVDDSGKADEDETAEAGAAVDLGLSVLWADCNVGTKDANADGDYFAWGETEAKTSYTGGAYAYRDSEGNYYTPDSLGDIKGTAYDVAHVKWAGKWRMPTVSEIYELTSKCTWTYDSSKEGFTVTGPNGKSIFLKCGGYKSVTNTNLYGTQLCYWTSENAGADSSYAYCLSVDQSTDVQSQILYSQTTRSYGYLIRPVRNK